MADKSCSACGTVPPSGASPSSVAAMEAKVDAEMLVACLAGDAAAAERFAAPSTANDKVAVSRLFLACASGSYALAKTLVDAGANVSDEPELLFLVISSSYGVETKIKILDLLLANGADADGKVAGRTPLQAATKTRCSKLVEFLIQRGAHLYAFQSEW